ncbi:glycosyltransferase family 2 protein [Halomonas sediminis]
MQPEIEILLATWNGERYLKEQLDSLLAQTNTSWQLIAHDDGSSDATLDILHTYQRQYPERIQVLEDGQRFGNACGNFAHLLKHAQAPYVMFCDQDDIWLPFKVEVTLNAMQAEEAKCPSVPILVHTDLQVVDAQGNKLASSFFDAQQLPREYRSLLDAAVLNRVTGCTVMLNQAAIDEGTPIPRQALMHDWWLACRTLQAGGKVVFVNQPTMGYRQHGGNVIGAKAIGVSYYAKRLLALKDVATSLQGVIKQARALGLQDSTLRIVGTKLAYTIKRVIPHAR